jgi:hypothetical protein
MDTHIAVALAHLLFNVPLAVWILEGFMSGIPREIDETAYIDGYSFPRFFLTIFLPLIKAGVGVAAFFCFMFSWVELLLARTLTSVNAKPIVATMTRTVSASGMDWATLAAAGVLTIVPGAIVIWFVRHYIAKGFAMGRVCGGDMFSWMVWTTPVAVFFSCIALMLIGMTVWEIRAHGAAQGLSADRHHARRPPVHRPAAGRLHQPGLGGAGREDGAVVRWSRSLRCGSASCCPCWCWRW